MSQRPLLLIHGYSASSRDFLPWASAFRRGSDPAVIPVHMTDYLSLSDEVSVEDIAEGFARALDQVVPGGGEFDAIVHSTGMLVIRTWAVRYAAAARRRLKHLIALAPATFGSPLAHKGQGILGAIAKGNRKFGPDFLESGEMVLNALELGSRFTWELTHRDLFGAQPLYGKDSDTPYVFTFCGTEQYGGIAGRLVRSPGTDGTVRLAGCSLNTRKVEVDLRQAGAAARFSVGEPTSVSDVPLVLIPGVNHGTILSDPPRDLVQLVQGALEVDSDATLAAWCARAEAHNEEVMRTRRPRRYQQFIVRMLDDRGDPVPEYTLQLWGSRLGRPAAEYIRFDMDVHPCRLDTSLRAFHVDLDELDPESLSALFLQVIAVSGSANIEYRGFREPRQQLPTQMRREHGQWDAVIDLSGALAPPEPSASGRFTFFYPFTTTLLELVMDREPNGKVVVIREFKLAGQAPV